MTAQISEVATPSYWMTSIIDTGGSKSLSVLKELILLKHLFVFGLRTPGRTKIADGDWLCFYAGNRGIVGHARICSPTYQLSEPLIRARVKYSWAVNLDSVSVYPNKPLPLTSDVRAQLDAFKGREASTMWSWFVQATRRISEHDFQILTRAAQQPAKI